MSSDEGSHEGLKFDPCLDYIYKITIPINVIQSQLNWCAGDAYDLGMAEDTGGPFAVAAIEHQIRSHSLLLQLHSHHHVKSFDTSEQTALGSALVIRR